jgi:hypothetical protein
LAEQYQDLEVLLVHWLEEVEKPLLIWVEPLWKKNRHHKKLLKLRQLEMKVVVVEEEVDFSEPWEEQLMESEIVSGPLWDSEIMRELDSWLVELPPEQGT